MTAEMNIVMIQFEYRPDLIHINQAAGQMMWNTVIMVLKADMVVGSDSHFKLDAGDFKPFCGKWFRIRQIERFKALPARLAAIVFHRPIVENFKFLPYRSIHLIKGEELPIAQPGKDKSLDMKNRTLHHCFVPGLFYSCRKYGNTIMFSHLRIQWVGNRVVTVGFFNPAFEIIRNKPSWVRRRSIHSARTCEFVKSGVF